MKTIRSISTALLLLVAITTSAHASCLGNPFAMKEPCESDGGTLEVTKDAHVCRWGDARDNHFVRLDCSQCLKGCNADGPLSKAGFEKLGITRNPPDAPRRRPSRSSSTASSSAAGSSKARNSVNPRPCRFAGTGVAVSEAFRGIPATPAVNHCP